jgi:hypothetical protein
MATYDFTGFVYDDLGTATVPAGTTVSGSFTVDYDAVTQTQGPFPSSTATWIVNSDGGLLAPSVFTETVTIGGTSYSSIPTTPYGTFSQIVGGQGQFSGTTDITDWSDIADYVAFSFYMANQVQYSSVGLPEWSSAATSLGGTYFYSTDNGTSQGTTEWLATSLTLAPVPLPATSWLLMSGLAWLGAVRAHIRMPRSRATMNPSRRDAGMAEQLTISRSGVVHIQIFAATKRSESNAASAAGLK